MSRAAKLPRVSFPPPLIAPAGFAEAIADAYEGNTARLCDYLHSDKRLGPIQRNLLADLIYRGLHRGQGQGTPAWFKQSTSRLTAICESIHAQKDYRCNQTRRKKVPRATRSQSDS
jgi:hypothetical protein